MNIKELIQSGGNISVTVNVLDLKEAFSQWAEENKPVKQEATDTKLVSAADAIALLGVTRTTLARWAASGYLMPIKVGKKVKYRKSDVDKIMGA